MLPQNTRESALRREDFHQALKHWLDESYDSRVGDADSHAGPAWLWVRHGGNHYYLNAGSTREGVRSYLRAVAENDGDPKWSMQPADEESRERVAVGDAGEVIDGFEFYRHVPRR